MARPRTRYRCSSCGHVESRWAGRCSGCSEWNTLSEEAPNTGAATGSTRKVRTLTPTPIQEVSVRGGGEIRLKVGIGELDRILGGGLVAGSLVLLGGDPGVGKSTLLLMALDALGKRGLKTLYVTGEESLAQVRLRADRLGLPGDGLSLLAETDLPAVVETVRRERPSVLVLDSVQTLQDPGLQGVPGAVSQVRQVASQAMALSKGDGIATFLIGHVTKEGGLAGPRMLEHLVDTVIYFEGDGRSSLRMLRAVKNRFGPTGETGLFEMRDEGLVEVPDASARLLQERVATAPGTCVVAAMEGSRPVLAEVQALVGAPGLGSPARTAVGLDRGRLMMLLAVLGKLGLPMSERDVFVSATGGLRIVEPAVDLGLVAAIASSFRDRPLDEHALAFGEVGLVGEVRAVGHPLLRLKEAAQHGFRRAIVPASSQVEPPPGLKLVPVRTVREALEALLS
jgi:DNA repair protein RadA/Sms